MKDYYKNTRSVIDQYNQIVNEVYASLEETTDEEDEFITNFYLYLSHALIKDTGLSRAAIEELHKISKVLSTVN